MYSYMDKWPPGDREKPNWRGRADLRIGNIL